MAKYPTKIVNRIDQFVLKDRSEQIVSEDKPEPKPKESGFFLFLSVDLVNFTKIKQREPFFEWGNFLDTFYSYFKSLALKGIKVWKLLGDEVIFVMPISEVSEIPKVLLHLLHRAKIFEEGSYPDDSEQDIREETDQEEESKSEKSDQTIRKNFDIRVKLAAWIIEGYSQLPSENRPNTKGDNSSIQNMYFNTSGYTGQDDQDYVGEHMDAGFRLKSHTVPGVLALSVELYYVLEEIQREKLLKDNYLDEAERILERSRIVGYRKLKGVGNGAPYSIIWFAEDWEEVKNLFFTPDYHENEFIRYINKGPSESKDFKLEDTEKTHYYKHISKNSDYFDRIKKATVQSIPPVKGKSRPLHVVVITFIEIDGVNYIMLRKRGKNKEIHPEKFDFGCAKLSQFDESIEDAISKRYQKDFGLTMPSGIIDNRPVAMYQIANGNIFGIIFSALIKDAGLQLTKETKKTLHRLNEALNMRKDDFVPMGLENIKLAMDDQGILPLKG